MIIRYACLVSLESHPRRAIVLLNKKSVQVWNNMRVSIWWQKFHFWWTIPLKSTVDVLKQDCDGQTFVTDWLALSVFFFHFVVLLHMKVRVGGLCMCECVCVKIRTKTDSGRAWWSGCRLAAPEEFISTCCSANREFLSPTAHSGGKEKEDVTLLWFHVSGCRIETFKKKKAIVHILIFMLACWWMTYQLALLQATAWILSNEKKKGLEN